MAYRLSIYHLIENIKYNYNSKHQNEKRYEPYIVVVAIWCVVIDATRSARA